MRTRCANHTHNNKYTSIKSTAWFLHLDVFLYIVCCVLSIHECLFSSLGSITKAMRNDCRSREILWVIESETVDSVYYRLCLLLCHRIHISSAKHIMTQSVTKKKIQINLIFRWMSLNFPFCSSEYRIESLSKQNKSPNRFGETEILVRYDHCVEKKQQRIRALVIGKTRGETRLFYSCGYLLWDSAIKWRIVSFEALNQTLTHPPSTWALVYVISIAKKNRTEYKTIHMHASNSFNLHIGTNQTWRRMSCFIVLCQSVSVFSWYYYIFFSSSSSISQWMLPENISSI